jgi:hypothetical protein
MQGLVGAIVALGVLLGKFGAVLGIALAKFGAVIAGLNFWHIWGLYWLVSAFGGHGWVLLLILLLVVSALWRWRTA